MIGPRKLVAVFLLFVMPGAVMAQSANDGISCPAAPPPVLSLSYGSRYDTSDSDRSILDRGSSDDVDNAQEPLDDFIADLSDQIAGIYDENANQTRIANCVLAQMATWADANALSELGTENVKMTIGSRLSAFSMILMQANWHANSYSNKSLVTAWLNKLMHAQMDFWEDAPSGARQGNLRAWAALAAASLSMVNDDPVLRSWAIWSVNYVLCSADEDGSLPQEMRRGRYALHYQLHAVAPLVTTVALLKTKGQKIEWACNFALRRTAEFALDDLATGANTRRITGDIQSFFDGSSQLGDHQMAWLEAYLWLFPDRALAEFVSMQRPYIFSKLGGNQSLLWSNFRTRLNPN